MPLSGLTIIGETINDSVPSTETINDSVPSTKKLFDAGDIDGDGREEIYILNADTFAGPKDAVLAISFTPYASETVSLTRAASQKGVPVVSVTDSPFSPLAQLAGQWIEISEANFEGFRSMAATLTLAMTLTVAIAERRAKTA